VGLLPVAEVQRPAAVGQPAHDDPVAAQHLHAIDAQVLARLLRSLGHHQPPGNERSDIPGPAGLDRQLPEIHRLALPHQFLTGGGAAHLGRHIQHLAEHRQLLQGVLHPLGRLRLLQIGQQPTDLPQRLGGVRSHAQGHPPRGAEQVAQQRQGRALDPLEQQRRPAGPQSAVTDLGNLQVGVHLDPDALELPEPLQLLDEIPEIGELHAQLRWLVDGVKISFIAETAVAEAQAQTMHTPTPPPLVSVVIVNYNGGPYLLNTVASALSSTVPIELFVVDNGSVDGRHWIGAWRWALGKAADTGVKSGFSWQPTQLFDSPGRAYCQISSLPTTFLSPSRT